MKRFFPILALVLTVPLFGQGVRIDLPLRASGPNVPVSGGPLPQSLILANAKVSICTHPTASIGACTPVTTYTDVTLNTPCPTNTPIVQLPGSACVATTGVTGNIGFWYAGGVVDYFVSGPYGLQGPYTTSGGTVGPPSTVPGPPGPPGGAANITPSPQFSLFYQPLNGTQSQAQGDSNVTTDGSGHMQAITTASSANTIIYVKARPYNAKCDEVSGGNLTITAGVTSGYSFASTDVGKSINGIASIASGGATYSGTISSVASGNATVSGSPTITLAYWKFGTDDQAAIQSAFNDALPGSGNPLCFPGGCSIQFPAGRCLTSTITYEGQSFFGAGMTQTIIVGQPGQDVFQLPDSNVSAAVQVNAIVHDFEILLDVSVDASATAAGGNNTFPNRVAGTAQGLTGFTVPITPGPLVFGYGNCSTHGATISLSTPTTVTISCAINNNFTTINQNRVIGAPITINGAGVAGGVYTGTVTAVGSFVGTTQTLTISPAASTAVTSTTGSVLNPITPPWYLGNAAFAFQCSNGSSCVRTVTGWRFRNIWIQPMALGTNLNQYNHCAAFFMQTALYGARFENLLLQYLYGGYVEAAPFSGPIATPDTETFKDIDIYGAIIPFVTYNGNDRALTGMNFYASGGVQSMGPYILGQVQTSSGNANWVINKMYVEGPDTLSGEAARFMAGPFVVNSASMLGGAAPGQTYVEWLADASQWQGFIDGGLHVAGGGNIFNGTRMDPSEIVDTGADNKFNNAVISGTNSYMHRRWNDNPKPDRNPLGNLNADFLLGGSATTPYLNSSDLITTCDDWGFAINPALAGAQGTCNFDPTGAELNHQYFQSASATQIFDMSDGGTVATNAWSGQARVFGSSILAANGSNASPVPTKLLTIYVQGECVGASTCSATARLRDETTATTVGATGTVNFTNSWSVQSWTADATGATVGDAVGFRLDTWTNAGTNYNIAWIAISPYPTDTVNAVNTGLLLPDSVLTATTGSPTILLPKLMTWGSGTLGVDTTSPTGYSFTLSGNTGYVYGAFYNGSSNFQGGLLFPALQSTITYTMNAPPVWADTLNGSLTSVATTCVLTTGALSSWNAGGYFLVDQEILGYTAGPPSPGTTSFTCTRGNFGTIAQAHSSLAAVQSVPTAEFVTKCNGNDASTGRGINVPILPSWNPYTQTFEAQACSGYNPSFNIFSITGPTGQTLKLGAITISSIQGILPTPTGPNQTISSVTLANGGVAWSFSGLGNLTGLTGTITGTALTSTCDSGTATVTGAVVGSPVAVSSTTGADVGGAFYLRGSVTSSNTVTVYVCGTGTPSSLAYNVRVIQ